MQMDYTYPHILDITIHRACLCIVAVLAMPMLPLRCYFFVVAVVVVVVATVRHIIGLRLLCGKDGY